MVPADHGLVPREHDAVQREAREDAAAEAAQQVARLARPRVPAVAVEGAGGVVGGRYDECGVGVGGDTAVFGFWGGGGLLVSLGWVVRREVCAYLRRRSRGARRRRAQRL